MNVFRWRRERPEDADAVPEVGQELVLWADAEGVLVAGAGAASKAVEVLANQLAGGGGRVVPMTSTEAATTAAAVFASGFADGATSGSAEYVQLTGNSRELLTRHGAIPVGDGAFHSVVQGDGGRFVGNLQWRPVDLGAERALAFQSMAIGVALRAAIHNVEVAVERVADQVEDLAARLRAERLGEVLGDRRTLESLVERARAGRLSQADWMSVAALGPVIARDIEELRVHARSRVTGLSASRPRTRAEAAGRLISNDQLPEILAVLVVAEHNLALWHDIKLHHLRAHEPDFVASELDEVRRLLADQRIADQELVEAMRATRASLLDPSEFDGLAPVQSRRMQATAERFDELLEWFADQRHLELGERDSTERPGVVDSLRSLGGVALGVAEQGRARLTRNTKDRDAERPVLPEGED